MKKVMFLTVVSFLILSCDTTGVQNSDEIIISKLEKSWTHSREEETDSVQIYRPSNYKDFPLSRYRQAYSFDKSGECEYLVLAANDAHYFNHGMWNYIKENRILTILDSSNQIEIKFELVELSDDLLRIVDY